MRISHVFLFALLVEVPRLLSNEEGGDSVAGNEGDKLLRCIRLLLRPAVEFALMYGVRIQELEEELRRTLIEQSVKVPHQQAKAISASKVCAMTGIHRRDVVRILGATDASERPANVITKVIGTWQHDSRFCLKPGRARVLTCGFDGSDFQQLVASINKDVHAGAILFELERIGSVRRVKDGVKLVEDVHVIRDELVLGLRSWARDVQDLFRAIVQNLSPQPTNPQPVKKPRSAQRPLNLQARTEFDNIDPAAESTIRKWFLREGTRLHRRARRMLAQFDKDLNPKLVTARGKRRVVFSTFSFSDEGEDFLS